MKVWNLVIVILAITGISYQREVSYEELITLRVKCHPYDTCNTTRDKIDAPLRSCQCDNSCALYGDCCLDAEKRSAMERMANRNNKCIKINDFQAYFMVTTCKNSWRDFATKLKCERNPIIEDPFTSIPAMSKRSKITYKNQYCATCNEDGDDLNFWKVGMTCPKLDNALTFDISDNIVYNPRSRTWGVRLHNNTFIRCTMDFHVPENKENLRFCYPNMISTCSSNWEDNFIREKCESYTAVLLGNQVSENYRNVHCAICNRINISDVNCPSILQRKLPGSPNFTHLFNVEKDDKDPNSRCRAGEIWDAAFKKCRKLSCGLPFLEFKNGKCVPKS